MQRHIIQSLLDTDLYKFTMLQVVLHQFPQAHGVYEFRCRNLDECVYPLVEIRSELEAELDALCTLRFTPDELNYLRSLRFIKSDFVDYLELFQLKRRFIQVTVDEQNRLCIRVEGPIIQAMFFEIFVLAIVNELYFRRLETPEVLAEGERRLQAKADLLRSYAAAQEPGDPPFLVSDFGTRRRYNLAWQEHVVRTLNQAAPDCLRGTSNVYLAKKLGLIPIGTVAHEFMQAFQALDVRLRDFDLYFAKLFDGLRHDSGDPYVWGEKAYAHYQKLKIDSRTKMLTFSDGLDLEKAWALHQYFKDRFKTSFGIGTNLTNDMGHKPLNIVLKLVECNGQSVAKLSDSPGKTMSDNNTFLAYLRQVFQIAETPK